MLVEDFGETLLPDLVAKDEADQTVENMRGAHCGNPVRP
jgi:hypothetical protein